MSDMYQEWLRHPMTKALMAHMQGRADRIAENLVNANTFNECPSSDKAGLVAIAYSNQLQALAPYLDHDQLEEEIGNVA